MLQRLLPIEFNLTTLLLICFLCTEHLAPQDWTVTLKPGEEIVLSKYGRKAK